MFTILVSGVCDVVNESHPAAELHFGETSTHVMFVLWSACYFKIWGN